MIFWRRRNTNWGIAWLDADLDSIVRKQWPFPSPGPSPPAQSFSLPWQAALLAGAKLDNNEPRERWLRYYHEGTWTAHQLPLRIAGAAHELVSR